MNYQRYTTKAKFISTNRIRTTILDAFDEAHVNEILESRGFEVPALTIEKVDHEMPSSSQIDYAKSLEVNIPFGATKIDVSALISMRLEMDSVPNPGLYAFADNRKIFMSKFIGKKALYDKVYFSLSGRDKMAFFIYCIYRSLSEDRRANLDEHPYRNEIYRIADEMCDQVKLFKSASKYEGRELRYFGIAEINGSEVHGGSINTYAYKYVSSRLSELYGIEKTKKFVVSDKRNMQSYLKSHTEKPNKAGGCASLAVAFALLIAFCLIF